MENLKISTISACGELSATINLINLLNNLNPNDFIKYIETKQGIKGKAVKNLKKKRKNINKNEIFFNQCTLILFHDNKLINLKIFSNKSSKIQICGLKKKNQGSDVINKLIKYILHINNNFFNEQKICNKKNIYLTNYYIIMMNTDYDFKMNFDLNKMYEILYKKNYFVSYSPDRYAGINCKYFWNSNNNNGICCCNKLCNGKCGNMVGSLHKTNLGNTERFKRANIENAKKYNGTSQQDRYRIPSDLIYSLFLN